MAKIEVISNLSNGKNIYRDTKVFVNGEEIEGIRSVKFEHSIYCPPTLTLTVIFPKININGDFKTIEYESE